MNWNEQHATGGDYKKAQYLYEVQKGKSKEFLYDVLAKYKYQNKPSDFKTKCYRVLCSAEYIEHIEKHVLGSNMSNYYLARYGYAAYGQGIKKTLEDVAKQIENDLKKGERDNDYIKDESATKLKTIIKELEKCGITCYSIERKIDKLAWFVGGDEAKIKELQRKLNELGIQGSHGKLKEDGVYGKETLSAWNSFRNKLIDGSVPILNWIDPLQSNLTNIDVGNGSGGINNVFNSTKTNFQYFRVDAPHNAKINFPHINIDFDNPTALQTLIKEKYNHYPLTDDAHNILKNFDNIAKPVRVAGKVLLVAGVALDALELYNSIELDRKISKNEASTAASIGGRWAGSIAGAKLGAMVGASIGSVFPGPGTFVGGAAGGLVLGIVGSFSGDKLAKWIVDITYVGE